MTHERVPRWRVGTVAAASLAALGLLYASPLLLSATLVPLGYVVYGSLSAVPADAAVRVERSFADAVPSPGDRVSVSLTVENVSDATIPDLRVVDGVPAELAVVEGSPRRSLVLQPGESATVTYDVVARRGDFDFADPVVRLRSLAAGQAVTETLSAAGETTLSSFDPVSDSPVGKASLLRAGTHPTDSGGEGVEFWSTREYRPGDPISRIDWRRFAKTTDLTTVSFREERAVRTALVVDARAVGDVRAYSGAPTAAARTVYAAERLYEALDSAGVTTSVAAFGLDESDVAVPTGPGTVPWVSGDATNATALVRRVFEAARTIVDSPRSGESHSGAPSPSASVATGTSTTASESRSSDPSVGESSAATADGDDTAAETPTADGGSERVRLLLSQFPATAQVVFVTPLLDDWPVAFARTVRDQDYPVTVLSPAAVGSGSLGRTVAGIERRLRLQELSAAGVTTVGWDHTESMDAALADSLTQLLGGGDG